MAETDRRHRRHERSEAMNKALIEIGKKVVIGMTLTAWCAAIPAPAWADRTPEQVAENIRKMQERFRENDRKDAERARKAMAEAAERARKKADERLLAQVEAAEKLGPNLSPTGVMVKDGAGNWVDADRSGRPLPPPEPPRKPFDPKAKEAAEKKVREAFERDRRKALEDQAKRDKEAEDKAAERRARYGLKPGEDAGPTGIMIKVGGNWVPAGLDGKPLPAPRPKVDPRRLGALPPDPAEAERARLAAEARVREAFARDRQKALDDAARRDRAADDKAGERLLKYGAPPTVAPKPAPVSVLSYSIPDPPKPLGIIRLPAPRLTVPLPPREPAPLLAPAPAPKVSALNYVIEDPKPAPAPRPNSVDPPAPPAPPTRNADAGLVISSRTTRATQPLQATPATQVMQFKAGMVSPAQAAATMASPAPRLVIGR
jgi:hypothetical protein